LLFGAEDEKGGGVLHGARIYETQKNLFIPKVTGGIEKEKCAALLKKFFKNMREAKNANA
jgi:tRNA(adenine34) deaminase